MAQSVSTDAAAGKLVVKVRFNKDNKEPPESARRQFIESSSAYGFNQLTGYSRVLMLQGPNGPFFSRLRKYLEAGGTEVWKVNFNAGDDLFFRGRRVVRFAQPMSEWDGFLESLLTRLRVDAIVVFGGSRRMHRIAARMAKALKIAFWVFEEGYVRPNYITLEKGGVNADSPLAIISIEDMPILKPLPTAHVFRHAFVKMAWYSFCYFSAGLLGQWRYRHYRHHKPFSVREAALWLRAGYRRLVYKKREKHRVEELLSSESSLFLVPLQVYNDSQIRIYSPWRRMEDFIEWTIFSFARHAPSNSVLIVKHHPMDRGHTNYAHIVDRFARKFGAVDRVVYVHDAHLPSLLHRCAGVITVNSTTGLQALYHGVPVITLGRCFYDKAGLTFQGSLDSFWSERAPVDMSIYRRFRNFLVWRSQINSSFYADSLFDTSSSAEVWHKGWRVRLAAMATLMFADTFLALDVDAGWIASTIHRATDWLVS